MFNDQISLDRISLLHPSPLVRDEARSIVLSLWAKDIPLRVTQGLRTWAEQDKLYLQGRKTAGEIVTHAPGGWSYHNYGLALDFVLLDKKKAVYSDAVDLNHDSFPDWQQVVEAFKAKGWEWGGDWRQKKRDKPHFQKTFGLSIKQLLVKSEHGKIKYVKI